MPNTPALCHRRFQLFDIRLSGQDQIQNLTREELQSFSVTQLQSLSATQIQSMSNEQITTLTEQVEVNSLTETQVDCIVSRMVDLAKADDEELETQDTARIEKAFQAFTDVISNEDHIREFETLAEDGDALAQLCLAQLLLQGDNISKQDKKRAVQLLTKAAYDHHAIPMVHAHSSFLLAGCLLKGDTQFHAPPWVPLM